MAPPANISPTHSAVRPDSVKTTATTMNPSASSPGIATPRVGSPSTTVSIAYNQRSARSDRERPTPSARRLSRDSIEAAVRAVIHAIRMSGEREIASRRIGEFVMNELRKLDHVGYVRFASVYRSFEDVADFREEIEKLERDLPPGAGQLSLLGGDVVPFDKHADKNKKR